MDDKELIKKILLKTKWKRYRHEWILPKEKLITGEYLQKKTGLNRQKLDKALIKAMQEGSIYEPRPDSYAWLGA